MMEMLEQLWHHRAAIAPETLAANTLRISTGVEPGRGRSRPLVGSRKAESLGATPHVENLHLSKTVLLVEDLDMLRKMVRDFMESLGIEVLEASNGAGAIDTARSHLGTIDLLLTDVENAWDVGLGVSMQNRCSKARNSHYLHVCRNRLARME